MAAEPVLTGGDAAALLWFAASRAIPSPRWGFCCYCRVLARNAHLLGPVEAKLILELLRKHEPPPVRQSKVTNRRRLWLDAVAAVETRIGVTDGLSAARRR